MICVLLSYCFTSGRMLLHLRNIFGLLQCFRNFEFYLLFVFQKARIDLSLRGVSVSSINTEFPAFK